MAASPSNRSHTDLGKDEEAEVKYCCPALEYYSKTANLVDTLEISPRVIKCKKSLRVNEIYEQSISVKNIGIHPRSISINTDSPDDIKLSVCDLKKFQYLMPSATFSINLFVKPTTKESLQNTRRIFIESKHPNVRIEIPIIAFNTNNSNYCPNEIELLPTVPKTCTYYEFIIYNGEPNMCTFSIRTLNACLTVLSEDSKINRKDFVRVLLKLKVMTMTQLNGSMKLNFGNANLGIAYSHQPKIASLYWSTKLIHFGETKFDRRDIKKFTICNETDDVVPFQFQFDLLGQCSTEVKSDIFNMDMDENCTELSATGSYFDTIVLKPATKNKVDEDDAKSILKTFSVKPEAGVFQPKSSNEIEIIFYPLFKNLTFDNKEVPPFILNANLLLTDPKKELPIQSCAIIEASVDGPEMYITPKNIDFRKVYLGEEHCEHILITNIDTTVNAEVSFSDYTNPDMAKAYISPDRLTLTPCETGQFTFTFFSVFVGKLFFQLRFKVQNGPYLIVTIKAVSVPVRVKTFPDIIEFGTIPIAVPQKRTVLLMNPLSVPISMQCFVSDNGSEAPLVLNVDNIHELPPVTIKNPIASILAAQGEDDISAYNDFDKTEVSDTWSGGYCSVENFENISTCSETFEKEVLEKLPKLSLDLLRDIKKKRILEKNEPEAKIINQATEKLMKLSYFEMFKKYNNYARMDWDALPSDPIEVYFDTEIINLSPNACHSFTFLIIPNNVGYFNRAISLRCCPLRQEDPDDDDDVGIIVDSELMVTKMWIEYNCCIPEISWNPDIDLTDRHIYAMQDVDFDIEFINESNIGGFLHFVVVPCCHLGNMSFRDDVWKFFIPSEGIQVAKCRVQFYEIGNVVLSGFIKIVGKTMTIPYHITANVLPPKISISPQEIYHRQQVLEKTVLYIYINNITPSVANISFQLRAERHQSINPWGAQLGPTGQGTYISLTSMYFDPDIHKNTIYVDTRTGSKIEIPLTFVVTGMPIRFDPDLTKGLDIGELFLITKSDYVSHKWNYSKTVLVRNMGHRSYSLNFTKHKITSNNSRCTLLHFNAQINIDPKAISLKPGEEAYLTITAGGSDEVVMSNEFRVCIVDESNPLRTMNLCFTITAKFSTPIIKWSKSNIRFVYKRTHIFKQHPHLDTVELINGNAAPITDVNLKVYGPFYIREFFEHPNSKELQLSIEGNERKEILIILNGKRIRSEIGTFMKGKICCLANEKPQKSLSLRVDINYPDIIIVQSQIVIFKNLEETTTEVALENVGNMDAEYKWIKLGECSRYVDTFDDYKNIAADLLYDLLRSLKIDVEDPRLTDPLCETNLQLCYQKYRCEIPNVDDPDNITDIIYEILDNLDYEHRRYGMHLSNTNISDTFELSETTSLPAKIARASFEQILNNLKLEDSFDISDPSLDECEKENHIYFYEKKGVVLAKEGACSLLHLPGVRKGHAVLASFVLDVVGGPSHKLIVTVANLEKVVEINPENIFLGIRPWYELFKKQISVQNTTQFKLNVVVRDMPRPRVTNCSHSHLIKGFACILNSRYFYLNGFERHYIKSEGITGLSSEFIRDFHIIINDHLSKSFRLRGQGVLPILMATQSNILRTVQTQLETVEEYKLLQRIYYFAIFKDITLDDGDLRYAVPEIENIEDYLGSKIKTSYTISELSLSECSDEEDTACEERIEANWELVLNSYFIVYNNESLPHASILEQLINMEKFIDDLCYNPYKRNILHSLYRAYTQFQQKYDRKIQINLKYFTVQPVPFEQWGYIIEMENLKLNQFSTYFIDLQFFGPGKLIAAARTAINIPGFFVHFSIQPLSTNQEFLYYRSDEKIPDFFTKKYLNMWERVTDPEMDFKLHHAHSYDCEGRCKYHKRDVSNKTARDRKDIKNYYNSLNKSVYWENKHHITNSIIYSKSEKNFSGTIFRVNIVIKPESKFFTKGQVFEEYLFIDLHMGPTLPILMRGLIK